MSVPLIFGIFLRGVRKNGLFLRFGGGGGGGGGNALALPIFFFFS